MQLKQGFMEMFLALMGNFLCCYEDAPPVADEGQKQPQLTAANIFDQGRFLAQADPASLAFLRELCKTQNFAAFIEKAYRSRTEPNEVSIFAEGASFYAKRGGNRVFASQLQKLIDRFLVKHRTVNILHGITWVAPHVLARRVLQGLRAEARFSEGKWRLSHRRRQHKRLAETAAARPAENRETAANHILSSQNETVTHQQHGRKVAAPQRRQTVRAEERQRDQHSAFDSLQYYCALFTE